MSRVFSIAILLIIIGFGVFIISSQSSKPTESLIGIKHDDQGTTHISQGKQYDNYNSDLASSGPHYADASSPVAWGVYGQELPPEVYLHNEEHGGIIVAYNPTLLPESDILKLKQLVLAPYSNPNFSPKKIIVMPKENSTTTLKLASWRYTMDLNKYDEATIIKFFTQHAGKAPEPLSGPTGIPTDQSARP